MLSQSMRLRQAATALCPGRFYPLTMNCGRPIPITPISSSQGLLAMPFDALRIQYASAVVSGLAQRSLLASGKWERVLDALEKRVLGPFARQR